MDDLTTLDLSGQVLSTKFLLPYARAAVVQRLADEGVPLDLEAGERITLRVPYAHDGDPSGFLTAIEVTRMQDDFNCVVGDIEYPLAWVLLQEARAPSLNRKQSLVKNASLETLLNVLRMVSERERGRLDVDQSRALRTKPENRLLHALRKARDVTRSIVRQQMAQVRLEIVLSIDLLLDAIRNLAFDILDHDIKIDEVPEIDSHTQFATATKALVQCKPRRQKRGARNWLTGAGVREELQN